jgi:hypothetical protein
MLIWRWPLSQTIIGGHCLSSLFIAYDECHVLEKDERVVGVKKNFKTFLKRKQSESKDEGSLSMIDQVPNNESICSVSLNSCCFFNYCQYFLCENASIVREEFWNLSFTNQIIYILDIPKRLHQKVGVKKRRFVTIRDVEICEVAWYKIVGISRSMYLFYKKDNKCGTRQRLHGNVGMKKS